MTAAARLGVAYRRLASVTSIRDVRSRDQARAERHITALDKIEARVADIEARVAELEV